MRILIVVLITCWFTASFALDVTSFHSDYRELVRVEISGPSELRLVFPRDVPSQWAIDDVSSYLRFNSTKRLALEPRRRRAAERRFLYAHTAEPLKPGQYTYHFVINSVAPPHSDYDMFMEIQTGAFQIVR